MILGHVRDRHFLLVLDNCEHLIEPTATIVERFTDDAPLMRVIATSREPLRVRGEHVHRLGALPYPEDTDGLPDRANPWLSGGGTLLLARSRCRERLRRR